MVTTNTNVTFFDTIDFRLFPSLRWIQLTGIGFDRLIDSGNIQSRLEQSPPLVITNMATASAFSLAEGCIYSMLHFYKKFPFFRHCQQNKVFANRLCGYD